MSTHDGQLLGVDVETAALRLAAAAGEWSRNECPQSLFDLEAAELTMLLALAEKATDHEPDLALHLLRAAAESFFLVLPNAAVTSRKTGTTRGLRETWRPSPTWTFDEWFVRVASDVIQQFADDDRYADFATATPADFAALVGRIERLCAAE